MARSGNENPWQASPELIGEAPPRLQPRSRRWIAWTAAILLVVLGGVLTYFAIVPLGASPLPWLLARVDGPVLRSPDDGTMLWVYFNDSGAMHSGNHWTWVVSEGSLGFRRVVAEGYLDGSVAEKRAAVPCEWLPDGSVRIHFLAHRRGDESVAREWLP